MVLPTQSARFTRTQGIGRPGGVGATRRGREHQRALKRLDCDVHTAFTALLKAGVKRWTEAMKHGSARRDRLDHIRMTRLSALTLSSSNS
jgi:hypothetical protein